MELDFDPGEKCFCIVLFHKIKILELTIFDFLFKVQNRIDAPNDIAITEVFVSYVE